MKINRIGTKEILDFEKEIKFELVVNERAINTESIIGLKRYYAYFQKSEVMGGGFLTAKSGNGNTIDEAILDYCIQVSNCLVAFNAYSEDRIEIQFPKLIHTKLLRL